MGYSMRANKRRQTHSKDPQRDQQFRYIAAQRERFKAAGLPIISVDTKKKELIGNFRNAGQAWCKQAEEVDADGPAPAASPGRPGHGPPGGGRIPRWLRQRLGWAPGARTSGQRGRFGKGGRKLGPLTAGT